MDDINNILRDLSIGKNYKGHREIAYAIQLLLEDEDRLCAVVKKVYIPVAKHFNVEWNAVECIKFMLPYMWYRVFIYVRIFFYNHCFCKIQTTLIFLVCP